jgi:SAM-dependent methyltransferase
MQNKHLERYLNIGFNKVEGFCPPQTLYVLDHFDILFQSDQKSIAEIGVHHGQFFIALNQLATSTSYAIDVFEDQHLNIDKSGKGNHAAFVSNLRIYDNRHSGSNVEVIKGDSLNLQTFAHIGSCDYISVDGGHTPIHVVNDLTNASRILKHDGVVVLDDYFNHWWPSVTEGLVKYLQMTPTLVPFCSSPNKMWMCNLSYKDKFLQHARFISNFGKTDTKFFGYDIIDLW